MTNPIPIRALEHFRYCPRQAALIHLDGIWFDNSHTVRGRREHQRVDTAPSRRERGHQVLRGIELWSDRYALIGRADAIEVHEDGRIEPVEYKAGRPHGDCAEIQLCAQALCLEEMSGTTIDVGHIWYGATRRRQRTRIDADLRERTIAVIAAVHLQLASATLPPAPFDERCQECQLAGHCLPMLVAAPAAVAQYMASEVGCF